MLETPAIVVGTEPGMALVEADYGGGCGSGMCAKGGCGTAVLGRMFTSTPRGPMQAENLIQAHAGERVVIGVEEGALLRTALVAYLLPLLMLLGGAVLGRNWFAPVDTGAAIGAVTGLIAGWLVARLLARRLGASRPVILRRI